MGNVCCVDAKKQGQIADEINRAKRKESKKKEMDESIKTL